MGRKRGSVGPASAARGLRPGAEDAPRRVSSRPRSRTLRRGSFVPPNKEGGGHKPHRGSAAQDATPTSPATPKPVIPCAKPRQSNVSALERARMRSPRGSMWADTPMPPPVEKPKYAGGRDINCLPHHLREACLLDARERLASFLVPRLRLFLLLKRRHRAQEPGKGMLTVAMMRKQKLFFGWPDPMVDDLLKVITLQSYRAGDIVYYEGEPGTSLVFILSGQLEVVKRTTNGQLLTVDVLSPLALVGEFSVLTDERRPATVRASSPAVLAVLLGRDFQARMQELPPSVLAEAMEWAFKKRREAMMLSPPDPELLRSCPLLNCCSSQVLTLLVKGAHPMVVPKSFHLARVSVACNAIYLLIQGTAEEQHPRAGSRRLNSPVVVNTVAVFTDADSPVTVRVLSTSELWVIRRERFMDVTQSPGTQSAMFEQVRRFHEHSLRNHEGLFASIAKRVPFLRHAVWDLCSAEGIKELFDAQINQAGDMVLSRPEVANRVVYLHKGRITLTQHTVPHQQVWRPGETVGWTCLVPHRWCLTAVAHTAVELLVIPRERYYKFLELHGGLEVVMRWTCALLFPCTVPRRDWLEAEAATEDVSIRAYPVSRRGRHAAQCLDWGFVGADTGPAVNPPSPPLPPPHPRELSRRGTVSVKQAAALCTHAEELRTLLAKMMQRFERRTAKPIATPRESLHHGVSHFLQRQSWAPPTLRSNRLGDHPALRSLAALLPRRRSVWNESRGLLYAGIRALCAVAQSPWAYPTDASIAGCICVLLVAQVEAEICGESSIIITPHSPLVMPVVPTRSAWRPSGRPRLVGPEAPRRRPQLTGQRRNWVDRLHPRVDVLSELWFNTSGGAPQLQTRPPSPPSWAGRWPAPPPPPQTQPGRRRQGPRRLGTTSLCRRLAPPPPQSPPPALEL
eukprot:Hpha_TRINITY_DN29768_c0_g1::TRINITY_DN29768_c0_g1_i1::g.2692::m.2692